MRLEIEGLSVALEGRDILRGVSLQVEEGAFLSLLGPSGCGKTTLLKAVAGILAPQGGRIRLGGEDITHLPPHRRGVVILFQDIRLFPHMTAAENVAFPLRMRGVGRRARLEQAAKLLERVRLSGYGPRQVGSLSGGERQRVALARALAARPRLLLLDEPFSALDENLREDMRELVLSLHREFRTTTVLVTHDRGEALGMSDQVALLFHGEIEQCGTPEAVYLRPATRRAAEYLGGCALLDGEVRSGIFRGGPVALPVSLPEGRYTLCLREQMWRPAEEGPYALTVAKVRFQGRETAVSLAAADGTLFQRSFPGAVSFQAGDVLRFDLDMGEPVFFPQEECL